MEEAFGEMDVRVESIGTTVQQLQGQQDEQRQRTQATLQSTAALEQRLHQVEQQRADEAAQHQTQLRDQRAHITYLENLVRTEVQSHKQANAALRGANEEQAKLKGEVQDLSVQLKTALDQIHNLSVDLAATRSLLDVRAQPRSQQQ